MKKTRSTGSPPAIPASSRSLHWNLLCLTLLAAWTFLVYSNTWHNEFVFDSAAKIVDNPQIRTLRGVWQEPYRIVTNFSYHLNYLWSGFDPIAYQLTSVVLHILNAWVIFWLGLLLLPEAAHRRLLSFLIALFFALHPLNSEAINYLNGRPMLLATMFGILSFIFHILAFRPDRTSVSLKKRGLSLTLSFLCLLLSIFSKETGLMFLGIIAFYYFSWHFQDLREWFRKITPWVPAVAVVGFAVPILLIFQLRMIPQPGGAIGLPEYWATQGIVAVKYAGLALLPLPSRLNVDHHVVPVESISGGVIAAVLFVLACAASVVWLWKRHRLMSLAVFWILITHAPTSLFPREDLMVEYRNYTPMVGFSFVAVLAFMEVMKRPRWLFGGLILLSGLYSVAVWERNTVWRTGESLWSDAVRKSPDKARPHVGLALAYLNQLQSGAIRKVDHAMAIGTKGLKEIETAIRITPSFYQSYPIAAGLNLYLARFEEAIRWCTQVIRILEGPQIPDDHRRILADAYNIRGVSHLNMGNVMQMIEECLSAIRYQPDYLSAYENVTLGYLVTGQFGSAQEYLARGLAIVPGHPILKMRQVLIDGIEHPVRWEDTLAELLQMPPRLLQSESAQIERFSRHRQLLEAVKKLKGALQ